MQDDTIKAYARAFAVVANAIKREDASYNIPNLIDKCSRYPVQGFTEAYQLAMRTNALTDRDEELIRVFLDAVDPGDIYQSEPLPPERQGVWVIAYQHWREAYTPAQAAEALGVTKQRISALIKDGKLDAIKAGKYVYISCASVQRRLKGIAIAS